MSRSGSSIPLAVAMSCHAVPTPPAPPPTPAPAFSWACAAIPCTLPPADASASGVVPAAGFFEPGADAADGLNLSFTPVWMPAA